MREERLAGRAGFFTRRSPHHLRCNTTQRLDMRDDSLSLVQGTLDILILQTLSWGPMHGYAVSRWIGDRTDGVIAVEDAALYQALHRMERKGWIEAEWGLSENNRRAKYYHLTRAGHRQLRKETATWRRYSEAVERVLSPKTV